MPEQLAGHPDRVKELFDAKASTWSAKYAPEGRLNDRLTHLTTTLSYLVPADGRVLDLGCGTGELSRSAAARGICVTACDISSEMLRLAASADRAAEVDWIQLDPGWRRLPFGPETFDAVVAASVLEYVTEPGAVLLECARVLRREGVLLCTVPDLTHPVRWFEWSAAAVARVSLIKALGLRWPRLEHYLSYLSTSQQRHTARWWRAVAARAGLHPRLRPTATARPSPLRLFAFQRTIERRDHA